ncbi:unnamed protein product [Adineta ricciae]|uniref:N-acetyltransferase domain-containing protein n=1 Tax=Adineta ricciae TaxID=249248 RepID=A0A814BZT8_ADIRI|nr:unnamed protein product [Adineta ricciae]CAF0984965.1 unnamed protein product [Adineta ricciae]
MDIVKELLTHRRATADDCDAMVTLINDAYSGQMSHQGWTNEYALNPAPRTNSDLLLNLINNVNNIFLVFFGADDQILKGCVLLSHKSECKTARIGMLSVRPDLQARGFGSSILSTAEKYAINNWNVEYIELTAIVQRPELISYYSRRGFIDTGARQRFVPTLPYSGEENAAIYSFIAEADKREIRAPLKEKIQAQQEYSQVLQQGNGAYLMEQNEKSTYIFISNVGALLPEEECQIDKMNEQITGVLSASHPIQIQWYRKCYEITCAQNNIYLDRDTIVDMNFLPINCQFNITRFGSNYQTRLNTATAVYNEANVRSAEELISNMNVNFGKLSVDVHVSERFDHLVTIEIWNHDEAIQFGSAKIDHSPEITNADDQLITHSAVKAL